MITLLHPSYGRPTLAKKAHDEWKSKCSDWDNVEYILSLDNRDPHLSQYKHIFNSLVTMLVSDSQNCVQATNIAAEQSNGDILIYLSDDFSCPQNWDTEIKKRLQIDKPLLLKVNDNLQPFGNTVLTIPIMTKALYNELGYFWYHEYESIWCDVDLYYECEKRPQGSCIVKTQELVFPHNHSSIGKAKIDNTTNQHDNKQRWESGKALFNKRSNIKGWRKKY